MADLRQWALAFLAVAGAFFLAGLAGSVATHLLGLWHLPGAGFAAALAVVLATYVAAPNHKIQLSCLTLFVGALVAWIILEPSWYPDTERYGALAYKATHLPLMATYGGGIAGLLMAFILRARTSA